MMVRRNGEYRLTQHARDRMREKGVRLPSRIPFFKCQVIEVTIEYGEITKFLVRFPDDCAGDICVSCTSTGNICTVYKNRPNDRHSTLDTRQYMRI
jgi:hypothetical protein